jgi:hypothetical protein
MQKIAREFNFGETTFVLLKNDPANSCRVRIFTPRAELNFAGHPTVGTACAQGAAVGVAGSLYRASVQCAYFSINPLYSSMAGNFVNLWGAGVVAQASFSLV